MFTGIPPSSDTPPATIGDPGKLLDIDMDQLTRMVSLIPTHGFTIRGPVTTIQTTNTSTVEDLLHGRAGPAHLVADMGSAPATLPAQLHDPPAARLKRGEDLTVARLVRAASGAKYETESGILFWTRGDEALVEWPQGRRFNCQRRR